MNSKSVSRETPVRKKILSIWEQSYHLKSAAEILHHVRKAFPRTHKTTIYRQLESLVTEKIVTPVPRHEGGVMYELTQHPHAHISCKNCRFLVHHNVNGIHATLVRLARRFGVSPDSILIEIVGMCRKCKK